ncbi:hypothetical protein EN858_02170 [Mesorhizobium sp. M4B.F.Ca.ET.215.01.1.1]|uniref:hypothetical protein n=1 Tax=unclassified Mesorhizobium TaxID=325217 RepID=UPI000FCC98D8|nr:MULTISPECIES: hypothetical protein [unclassified Mesorhizobium]RUW26159.1 hypothetical protein EOA34_09315 [Mesorhizobium sp. M4B.F.Ca.ET.013.02.1.1]RUW77850.1 hypothetical protein EOA31_03255 [Mesorhizobium sp. M4B.F.Ca.ET.049.02.1.2]RVD46461.1 hypothetical protein EN741_01215 [Mesorhizobium sp. M4B.F.Ca.ET.019.03.1.1]RWF66579.1 MAG: hypothetical protein EOS47_05670 [Mesorhizobium sp.]TGQ18596.1 hypothetical protein EN858_02170 [Mesorhizobium sp. M4B.F.Ca.ET.215.01.1.1]
MTGQVMQGALRAKQLRQLKEVYDRAREVKARYPESHIASRAAKRLIDAFETVIRADGTALETQWLRDANPKGNA